MTFNLRFAPSPTGRLHLGNARTALVNWLQARQAGGRFVLRLDDTDRQRSTEAFARSITDDLAWLGIDWDVCIRQSERAALYATAFAGLREQGLVYPAYETAEELADKRAAQRRLGQPPRYDRAALALDAADRAQLEGEGRAPHWRFRLSGAAIAWTDLVQGSVSIGTAALSDPVLVRADGVATYTLASVVDDLECGITQIVRGDDHRTNTAVQIELMRALGGMPPVFAHLPLILGAGGAPLSKRSGDWSLGDWRARGIEPHAIRLYLASLGTDRVAPPETSREALIREFDIGRFGRAGAVFDADQLARMSRGVFCALPLEAVRDRPGCAGIAAAEWAALRPNVADAGELARWLAVLHEPIKPVREDAELLGAAADLLPLALDDASAAAWLGAVQESTGRRGKALYHPLRLALTGRTDGPKLADLLPLLGRERVLRRLRGLTA
jgi:glutamyl-tRNA synthetase